MAREATEILVHEGASIDYDDEWDDVLRREFNESFEQASELFLHPAGSFSILKVANQNWPACTEDLYLPERPRTHSEALSRVIAQAWGAPPEPEDEVRTVGTAAGSDITRSIQVFVR